jgi:hypothetical protein
VKRPFDLMDLMQFRGSQRRNAVLHAKRLQFSVSVDAPLRSAGLNERAARGLVLGEKDRLAKDLAVHHDEWQPEQGEEVPFVWPGGYRRSLAGNTRRVAQLACPAVQGRALGQALQPSPEPGWWKDS